MSSSLQAGSKLAEKSNVVFFLVLNWWKGKPSGSIACTRKQQPRFNWSCSSVEMNDATSLLTVHLSVVNRYPCYQVGVSKVDLPPRRIVHCPFFCLCAYSLIVIVRDVVNSIACNHSIIVAWTLCCRFPESYVWTWRSIKWSRSQECFVKSSFVICLTIEFHSGIFDGILVLSIDLNK